MQYEYKIGGNNFPIYRFHFFNVLIDPLNPPSRRIEDDQSRIRGDVRRDQKFSDNRGGGKMHFVLNEKSAIKVDCRYSNFLNVHTNRSCDYARAYKP